MSRIKILTSRTLEKLEDKINDTLFALNDFKIKDIKIGSFDSRIYYGAIIYEEDVI